MPRQPCWVEISLTNLRHNFATLRDFVAPHATVCPVIKDDAYGHGAIECARAMQVEGAKWFAVANVAEALALREAGISSRLLLLSGFWPGEEELVLQHNLTPAVWDWQHIESLEDAAEKLDRAPNSVAVHLKIDTGMHRLGVAMAELGNMIDLLKSARFVMLEGAMSHLASAEILDSPAGDAQLQRFDDAIGQLNAAGVEPVYQHIANSAAIAAHERSWKNMVRPGISIYGYYLPFVSIINHAPDTSLNLPVLPVLSWKTRILAIRELDAHQPIGYNASYITQAPARIAVLPVGYGDGLSRHLSSRGRVIVRGDYANIVGTISMDLTTIDVTGIPGVDVGDEVVLIGEQGKRALTAWEHAQHEQTIPYEVFCRIGKRVERRYLE